MTDALKPNPKLQPIYEVIKREDLFAAFRDALNAANVQVLAGVDSLIQLHAAVQPSCLWVWDFTSRWDLDIWW